MQADRRVSDLEARIGALTIARTEAQQRTRDRVVALLARRPIPERLQKAWRETPGEPCNPSIALLIKDYISGDRGVAEIERRWQAAHRNLRKGVGGKSLGGVRQ